MKALRALTVGLLLMGGCRPQGDHAQGAASALLDHPFPAFAFASIPGRDSVRSGDLAGSTSLVVFWATWCGPCREEVGTLKQVLQKDVDLKIVGLSVDESPAAVPLLVNSLSIPYPVGVGANAFLDGLKIEEIPQIFLLDAKGVVRDAFSGEVDAATLEGAIARAREVR